MSLQIAIVGLPNVGKSTLFSAITKQAVDCANFPFCTIDPNVGVVEVPDERLDKLAIVSQSEKIVSTTVEFVDIAGLVRGAAEGQGLGNQFLSHIRECDAIALVLRAFPDPNVIHVEGTIDPARDAETILTELALKDLEVVDKRLQTLDKQVKAGKTKELEIERALLVRIQALLGSGQAARAAELTDDERKLIKNLSLLTDKPQVYVLNVSEEQLQDPPTSPLRKGGTIPLLAKEGLGEVRVSIKMEAELASLSGAERTEYLASLGQTQSGLDRLIVKAYEILDLITFFTSGKPETRAWTVKRGSTAPQAAGKIHTDFEKNFIRAEVVGWQDFVIHNGWNGCKDKGLVRIEGKEYIVQDGDVCYFRVGN